MSRTKTKLGDIFNISRGGSPRPISKFITDSDDGIPWIMIGDTNPNEKFISSTKKKIIPDGLKKTRMVYPGDFLLTNSMSFGRPYILNIQGCIHDGWLVLSPKEENVSRDYFFHLLGSDNIYKEFSRQAAGATVKNLNIELVSNVQVYLPPLPEQKRIAAILDQADALRKHRQRALDHLNQLGQSIFYEMFGDPISKISHPLRTLDDVCNKITDGTHDTPKRLSEGVLFITGKNIKPFKVDIEDVDYVSHEDHQEIYRRCNPENGDVLFTNIGAKTGVAVLNEFDFEFSMKNVALLKPNREVVIGRYLEYLLNEHRFKDRNLRRMGLGGAQGFMGLGSIKKIEIPVPPLEQQTLFSKRIDKLKDSFADLESCICKSNTLFASLQQRAFQGEL